MESVTHTILDDVAAAANVSPSTASKALNGTGRVSASTRRRVIDTARNMGYVPLSMRKRSRHCRTGLVALVTNDVEGRFALPALLSAERTLGAHNHACVLMNSHDNPQLEREHVDQIAALQVEGLIVLGNDTLHRRPLPKSITLGLPTVYAYSPVDDSGECSVISDDVAVGRMAIERLFAAGRRRIAVIAGDEYSQATRDRVRGCLEQFRRLSVQPAGLLYDSWTMEWGRKAALTLLEREPNLDGIYCLGDGLACGAIAALRSRGISVPSEVSVVGTGNDIDVHAQLHPLVSTIDVNMGQIGRRAALLLADLIRGRSHPGIHAVEPTFLDRESL